ncbi:uncharacterized protein LOC132193821 isoform X2 [Neocloeon triangulifer]|uniref:uncharacterized protein LOC132193821 isoform X2 n=1 Tax=Neocloeon triangulifer TaxID=2078957 RepID=UPI00286F2EFF|nr:uncharacterized protein LOC132193821 isoform X2 [Neocloeon triangulifer]
MKTLVLWIFVSCTCFNSAQSYSLNEEGRELINTTECWSLEKKKTIHEAPVFSLAEDNLSFEGCGRWNKTRNDEPPPWYVFIDWLGDNGYGVLVSDRTIVAYGANFDDAFAKGYEMKIYAMECSDQANCFHGRGFLGKKVVGVKSVDVKYGRFYSRPISVLQIEKVEFSAKLQPACLWNRENRNDANEAFHYFYIYEMKRTNFLPEERCFSRPKIVKWQCDLYGESICTSAERHTATDYLYVERENRFYLRALFTRLYAKNFTAWLDLLPFARQIASASVDLGIRNSSNIRD